MNHSATPSVNNEYIRREMPLKSRVIHECRTWGMNAIVVSTPARRAPLNAKACVHSSADTSNTWRPQGGTSR